MTSYDEGPKAYIIEEVSDMENSFSHQKLPLLRKLMTLEQMVREESMEQITPQFIISAHLEEDYKPFLDEVCNKIVING